MYNERISSKFRLAVLSAYSKARKEAIEATPTVVWRHWIACRRDAYRRFYVAWP